ncbi:hypothetical protein J43TS3_01720 [Ornithinibacillus bavariensis]|uniref:Uncharacterized protein n=1 Tax=Ornithinibacillus bavariensis TaxID=545502 RepID=A0A919X4V5_9BACI|nr:hypothetical protein J43TS3_01720 [Ornithinibacillus bavariensis]
MALQYMIDFEKKLIANCLRSLFYFSNYEEDITRSLYEIKNRLLDGKFCRKNIKAVSY